MKQMGWSNGKGLGLKEDGKTEHIKVSLKNDNRGLGCNQNVEDNWISHQDDFNDLLSNLHQEHSQETSTKNNPDSLSSIEEKSQKAKRRVHYKRFTRGKDLANRSVNDMNCILGRRSASGSNTPQSISAPSSDHENEEERMVSHGVKTIVNSVTMQEYFAQKMARMKELNVNGTVEGGNSPEAGDGKDGESPGDDVESQIHRDGENGELKRKKKKKGKKRKRKLEDGIEETGWDKKEFEGDMEEGGIREDVEGTVGARMNGLLENEGLVEDERLDGVSIEDEDTSDFKRTDGENESGECENGGEKLKKKKKKRRKVEVEQD
ncbi:PIN2/TERF1-interacting telomerase inhibitor 1 [Holothuria leucospilota]|uniref:PIN2/TERF1-interacting telomerase inhibitor 1 n=1 Tax=Holothuria leucospilota TaxID=206669 RepID=A0A9Q1HGF2_HOLLE|nr:PIN2/TERF1-interacting telomerase inhibitor 1 [Holothuria leucospilota]